MNELTKWYLTTKWGSERRKQAQRRPTTERWKQSRNAKMYKRECSLPFADVSEPWLSHWHPTNLNLCINEFGFEAGRRRWTSLRTPLKSWLQGGKQNPNGVDNLASIPFSVIRDPVPSNRPLNSSPFESKSAITSQVISISPPVHRTFPLSLLWGRCSLQNILHCRCLQRFHQFSLAFVPTSEPFQNYWQNYKWKLLCASGCFWYGCLLPQTLKSPLLEPKETVRLHFGLPIRVGRHWISVFLLCHMVTSFLQRNTLERVRKTYEVNITSTRGTGPGSGRRILSTFTAGDVPCKYAFIWHCCLENSPLFLLSNVADSFGQTWELEELEKIQTKWKDFNLESELLV